MYEQNVEENYQTTEPRTEEPMFSREKFASKIPEIQDKVVDSINKAMSTTAESLDKTADNIHKTAQFFKDKNAETIREDVATVIKKHPGKSLVGAALLGLIIGKIFSR